MATDFVQPRRTTRERRVATRISASGQIDLFLEGAAPVTISASLIETSATGFRAAHDSHALEPGLTVRFLRNGAGAEARVVWTHVLEGRRVSGFLLLEHPPARP